MNFLQLLKDQYVDPRNRLPGDRLGVVVDYRALDELIRKFESVDSELRARYYQSNCPDIPLEILLRHVVTACYYKNEGSLEKTILSFMETVHALTRKKQEEERYANRGYRSI